MRKINRKRYKKNKMIIITSILLVLSLSIGYSAFNTNLSINTKGNLKQSVWNFDYTGSVQTFTVPKTGTYKLETWGAAGTDGGYNGTSPGGYGGYSIGIINLLEDKTLYISVGPCPITRRNINFPNGASIPQSSNTGSPGGGATSIQNILIDDGQLKNYEKNIENVIIVSGAGGGSEWPGAKGGNGGGFVGENGTDSKIFGDVDSYGTGGTQEKPGENKYDGEYNITQFVPAGFGQGAILAVYYSEDFPDDPGGGGGAGFYGGGASLVANGGGGGSGYIGNQELTNKHMACYNCKTSDEESTKTISVTCASESPTKDCAKIGNGYARITYLGNE